MVIRMPGIENEETAGKLSKLAGEIRKIKGSLADIAFTIEGGELGNLLDSSLECLDEAIDCIDDGIDLLNGEG